MHERGLYTTKFGTILGKMNLDIRIQKMAYAISEGQNLLLKVGDANSKEFKEYVSAYRDSYRKTWGESPARDIKVFILDDNKVLNVDDICTLTNYLMLNSRPRVTDLLMAPEIKLKTFIQKLQFRGY